MEAETTMRKTSDLPWDQARVQFETDWIKLIEEKDLDLSLHPTWTAAIAGAKGKIHSLRVLIQGDAAISALLPYLVDRRRM